MPQSMGSQRVGHDGVTELTACLELSSPWGLNWARSAGMCVPHTYQAMRQRRELGDQGKGNWDNPLEALCGFPASRETESKGQALCS